LTTLLDIAQAAVAAAVAAGADWADAVCASARFVAVEVEKSSIRECQVSRDYGVGVRAFVNGGLGLASSQSLDLAEVRACGEQAASLAKATHPDPDFAALPEPGEVAGVGELFDDEIAGLSSARVVQWCQAGIEDAREVSAQVALSGGASLGEGESALASSTGIALGVRSTMTQIAFMAVVHEGEEVGAYFEYDVARRMADFVPEGVGRQATEQACRFLGARHVKTAQMPVVMGPLSAESFVVSPIAAADAESVQRKRTFMVGKAGERVASELLTVTEDPFIPAGVSSRAWDGEGVPKSKRALLDRGVLTTYLHNSYTANKAGVENTAHAARSGPAPGVGIGPSNLLIQPGERTEAELISEIDEGLYVNSAHVVPDSANGDVSATVDFGFKIENGELAYPVKNTMIGGDIFDLLGQVDAVSSDYREEPGSIVPSVRLSSVQVIGGE